MTARSAFCHGSPAGTNRTRDSPRTSRASSAIARWARWGGSKVPPRIPTAPGRRPGRGSPRVLVPGVAPHSNSTRPIRTVSPGWTPARRSAPSMPRRSRSRWKRSADSSTSKLVWTAIRSIRLPRTRKASPSRSRVKPSPAASQPVDDDAGRLGLGREARRIGKELGEQPAERVQAVAGVRRDGDARQTLGPPGCREGGPGLPGLGQVHLVEGDDERLVEERRVVEAELLADDAEVPLRVARRAVDQVDEDRGSARRGAGRRGPGPAPAEAPSMRPGHVGDRGTAILVVAEVHHPQVRLERGERVRRDLRAGRRQGREQRRLAGVRQPDEPDVGDEPQLQAQPALLARARPSGRAWACGASPSRSGRCRARRGRRARS